VTDWTAATTEEDDAEEGTVRGRRRRRRSRFARVGLTPAVFRLLGAVGAVWAAWMAVAFFGFPLTSPVCLLLLGYPVLVVLAGVIWKRILCHQDGVRPPGLFQWSPAFNAV
jgi:hypothetical protein